MRARAGLALTAAVLVGGCAVARMPEVAATREQTPTQHRLDVADCKAEVGYRIDYNGDDSPLANTLRRVFTLGAAGAAVGGLVTGLLASTASTASDGLIAGAGAGGLAGLALSARGSSRFEREWMACMESHGYRIVATPEAIH